MSVSFDIDEVAVSKTKSLRAHISFDDDNEDLLDSSLSSVSLLDDNEGERRLKFNEYPSLDPAVQKLLRGIYPSHSSSVSLLDKYGERMMAEGIILKDLFSFTDEEICELIPNLHDRRVLGEHLVAVKEVAQNQRSGKLNTSRLMSFRSDAQFAHAKKQAILKKGIKQMLETYVKNEEKKKAREAATSHRQKPKKSATHKVRASGSCPYCLYVQRVKKRGVDDQTFRHNPEDVKLWTGRCTCGERVSPSKGGGKAKKDLKPSSTAKGSSSSRQRRRNRAKEDEILESESIRNLSLVYRNGELQPLFMLSEFKDL